MTHCEYDNGYLVFNAFDAFSGKKEVWRLSIDFAEGEVATHSSPDEGQRRVSTFAAAMHSRYAPRGHFRPWANLSFPEPTFGTRLVYPALLSANTRHAFLHHVHTGALMQTIDVGPGAQGLGFRYVDVNERYAFVCTSRSLHVFAWDGGAEVLRIPNNVFLPRTAIDCRIYFSWEDARRRDIPLFKDGENTPKASSTGTQSTAGPSPEVWSWLDPEFGCNIPSLML